MAGKQCVFSDQKAGKRSLFSETWAGISTSTQWTPWEGLTLKMKYLFLEEFLLNASFF